MALKLQKESEKYLLNSIKRFMSENFDEQIGDLKAGLILEFIVKEIGPSIYNQAIIDAQNYIQEKTADLSGAHYEPEFDFWKKKPVK